MCTQIFSEGTPFYPYYPLEKSLTGGVEMSTRPTYYIILEQHVLK